MSLQRWQTIALCVGIAIVAILAWGIARTRDDFMPPAVQTGVTIKQGGAEGHRFGSKTANWSLDYDSITISPDQSFAELENIKDGTLFRNGKPYLKIKAKHVTVNIISNDFTATGHTIVRTLDGKNRTFVTDSLGWVNVKQQLTLEKPVVITETSGSRLTFERGIIDVKERTVDLQGMSADYGGAP